MEGIDDKTQNGQITGKAAPLLKGSVSYEAQKDPFAQIDTKANWSEEMKAQKKSEVANIKEASRGRENEINREHIIEQAKIMVVLLWKLAVLLFLAMAVQN